MSPTACAEKVSISENVKLSFGVGERLHHDHLAEFINTLKSNKTLAGTISVIEHGEYNIGEHIINVKVSHQHLIFIRCDHTDDSDIYEFVFMT
jgi:hypothetical protein